jgi:hypothetical protein
MRIHTETIDGLVAGARFTHAMLTAKPDWEKQRRGPRFSRHLMVDVEPEGSGWAVVFRSADKVLAGAGASEARNTADQRYHRAPLYYSDEAAKPRRFVLWSTADPNGHHAAEAIARDVLAFWQSRSGAAGFTDRWTALTPAAQPIVAALLAIFGASGPVGRVGTYQRQPRRSRRSAPTTADVAVAEARAADIVRNALADAPAPPEVVAQINTLLERLTAAAR